MEANSHKQIPSIITNDNKRQEQYLKLLQFNYDNLQKAVWDCHKVSWTITGIFVPMVSTALVILFKYGIDKEPKLDPRTINFALVLIAGVIVFWFCTISILTKRNLDRMQKLRKLEEIFSVFLQGDDFKLGDEVERHRLFSHHHSRDRLIKSLRSPEPPRPEKTLLQKICKVLRRPHKLLGMILEPIENAAKKVKFHRLTLCFSIFLLILLIYIWIKF